MDPPNATLKEFAADGYSHVEANVPHCRVIRLRSRRSDQPAGRARVPAARRVGPGAAVVLPPPVTPGSRTSRPEGENDSCTRPGSQPHDGVGRVHLSFSPSGLRRPGPPRRHRVRRGELERYRDRLHLRRARHLQEVQGPGPATAARPCTASTSRSFTAAQLARRLAAGLPRPGDHGPRVDGRR